MANGRVVKRTIVVIVLAMSVFAFWKWSGDGDVCERFEEGPSKRLYFTTLGKSSDELRFENPSKQLKETSPLEARSALDRATERDWTDLETCDELIGALVQWSEADPDAAIAWLVRVPIDVRQTAQREVAGAILSRRPKEAIALLSALPQSDLHAQMMRQAAMEYAEANPEEARRWALHQSDEQTRAMLLGATLCVQASDRPAEAAEGLGELSGRGDHEVVLMEVIQRWAQVNAVRASVFVANVSGPVSIPAVESLMAAWALRDPEGSFRWASERADLQVREAAIAAWARAVLQRGSVEEDMGRSRD